MTEELLEGAARVLARDGAAAFTTNRVAEAAGVSIGSLYQYYPNKVSLLLALHERDAEQVWGKLAGVLDDETLPPRARLDAAIQGFFDAEIAGDELHAALAEAQALISATPAFQEFESQVIEKLRAFLEKSLPHHRDEHEHLARVCFAVVTATGERAAVRRLDSAQTRELGAATARMMCDFLGV
ncbi:MAG: TetR/AcrR family transcriptional regulator [Parvibaculum sp.]|nr:TetR/AcrR family transcriptional regulator [Parvibaculum sp.]